MQGTYSDDWRHVVHSLTRIACGEQVAGGKKKNVYKYKNRQYVVKKGPRGGEYIVRNGRKIYLKNKDERDDRVSFASNDDFENTCFDAFLMALPERTRKRIDSVFMYHDVKRQLTSTYTRDLATLIYALDGEAYKILQVNMECIFEAMRHADEHDHMSHVRLRQMSENIGNALA